MTILSLSLAHICLNDADHDPDTEDLPTHKGCGPKGQKGEQGDKGEKGITNARGLTGVTGDKGLPGLEGLPGINVTEQGPRGNTTKGDAGESGPKGFDGPKGLPGRKGDMGASLKGPIGDKGPNGIAGNRGEIGNTAVVPASSVSEIRAFIDVKIPPLLVSNFIRDGSIIKFENKTGLVLPVVEALSQTITFLPAFNEAITDITAQSKIALLTAKLTSEQFELNATLAIPGATGIEKIIAEQSRAQIVEKSLAVTMDATMDKYYARSIENTFSQTVVNRNRISTAVDILEVNVAKSEKLLSLSQSNEFKRATKNENELSTAYVSTMNLEENDFILLNTNQDKEHSRRVSKNLNINLFVTDTLVGTRSTVEASLANAISEEISRAPTVENLTSMKLEPEPSRAIKREQELKTLLADELLIVLPFETLLDQQLSSLIPFVFAQDSTSSINLEIEITREQSKLVSVNDNLTMEIDRGNSIETNIAKEISREASLRSRSYAYLTILTTSDTIKTKASDLAIDSRLTLALSDATQHLAESDTMLQTDKDLFDENQAWSQKALKSLKEITLGVENSLTVHITEAKSTVSFHEQSTRITLDAYSTIDLSTYDPQISVINSEAILARNTESTLSVNLLSEKKLALSAESNIDVKIATDFTRVSIAQATLDGDTTTEKSRAMNIEPTIKELSLKQPMKAQANEATLAGMIKSEEERHDSSSQTIDNNINVVKTRGLAADSTLRVNIQLEIDQAKSFSSAIAIEIIKALTTSTTELKNTRMSLTNEIDRATTAEFVLNNNIDSVIDGSRTGENVISSLSSGFHANHLDLETSLSVNIEFVNTNSMMSELTLTQDLSTAISRSKSLFNTATTSDIPAVVMLAKIAEAALGYEISNQIHTDNSLFLVLSTAISTEIAFAGEEENSVSNAMGSEKSRAADSIVLSRSIFESSSTSAVQAELIISERIQTQFNAAQSNEKEIITYVQDRFSQATTTEAEISTSLLGEEVRARLAEKNLQINFNPLNTIHKSAEKTLNNLVSAEFGRATTEEDSLDAVLVIENNRAAGREKDIKDALNAVKDAVKFDDTDLKNVLIIGSSHAVVTEQALHTDITSEKTATLEEEAIIKYTFDSSSAARASNEQNLIQELNDLSVAALSKQYFVSSASSNEIKRAKGSEVVLMDDITQENSLALTNESSIKLLFATEKNRAEEKESRLKKLFGADVVTNGATMADNNANDIQVDADYFAKVQQATMDSQTAQIALAEGTESTLETQLDEETARRSIWEVSMASSIVSGSKAEVDRFDVIGTGYFALLLPEVSREKAAMRAIQQNTILENSRADTIEKSFDSKLKTVTQNAALLPPIIQKGVNNEKTRAEVFRSLLRKNLNSEISRGAKDIILRASIPVIKNVSQTAEDNLRKMLIVDISKAKSDENDSSQLMQQEQVQASARRYAISIQLTAEESDANVAVSPRMSSINDQSTAARQRESNLNVDVYNFISNSRTDISEFKTIIEKGLSLQIKEAKQLSEIENDFSDRIASLKKDEAGLKISIPTGSSAAHFAEKELADNIQDLISSSKEFEGLISIPLHQESSRSFINRQSISSTLSQHTASNIQVEKDAGAMVDAEHDRAVNAEKSISTAIDSEISHKVMSNTGLSTATAVETTSASTEETTSLNKIDAEISKNLANGKILDDNLFLESSRATIAEAVLHNSFSQGIIFQDQKIILIEQILSSAFALPRNSEQILTEMSRSNYIQASITESLLAKSININPSKESLEARAKLHEMQLDNAIQTFLPQRRLVAEIKLRNEVSSESKVATLNEIPIAESLAAQIALAPIQESAVSNQLESYKVNHLDYEATLKAELARTKERAMAIESYIYSKAFITIQPTEVSLGKQLQANSLRMIPEQSKLAAAITSQNDSVQIYILPFSESINVEINRSLTEETLLEQKANEMLEHSVDVMAKISEDFQASLDLMNEYEGYIFFLTYFDQIQENAVSNGLILEKERERKAHTDLRNRIAVESVRAKGFERGIVRLITAEKSRALKAEPLINASISHTASQRVEIEHSLSISISAEINRKMKVNQKLSIAIPAMSREAMSREDFLKMKLFEDYIPSQIIKESLITQAYESTNDVGREYLKNSYSSAVAASSTVTMMATDFSSQLNTEILRKASKITQYIDLITSTTAINKMAESNVNEMIDAETARNFALAATISTQTSQAKQVESDILHALVDGSSTAKIEENHIKNMIVDQNLIASSSESSVQISLQDFVLNTKLFEKSISEVLHATNVVAVSYESNALQYKGLLQIIESSMDASIQMEVSRASYAEALLSMNLMALSTSRAAVELILAGSVQNVSNSVVSAEMHLSATLSQMISSNLNSDQSQSAAIATGSNRAITEEGILSAHMKALSAGAVTQEDSLMIQLSTVISTSIENKNDSLLLLESEFTRASHAEIVLLELVVSHSSTAVLVESTQRQSIIHERDTALVYESTASINLERQELAMKLVETSISVALFQEILLTESFMITASKALLYQGSAAGIVEQTLSSSLNSEISRAKLAVLTIISDMELSAHNVNTFEKKISAKIENENSRSMKALLTTSGSLQLEVETATANEGVLKAAISTATANAVSQKLGFNEKLENEIVRGTHDMHIQVENVAAESSRKSSFISLFSSHLDADLSSSVFRLSTLEQSLIVAKNNAMTEEPVLLSAINAEINRFRVVSDSFASSFTSTRDATAATESTISAKMKAYSIMSDVVEVNLTIFIKQEESRSNSADNEISVSISTINARAQTVESSFTSELTQEIDNAVSLEKAVQVLLLQLDSSQQLDFQEISTAIQQAEASSMKAEETLSIYLSTTLSHTRGDENSSSELLLTEEARNANAKMVLEGDLIATITIANNSLHQINTNIYTMTSQRILVQEGISGTLHDEKSRSGNAYLELQDNLSSAFNQSKGNEVDTDNFYALEVMRASNSENSFNASRIAETIQAVAAEVLLSTELNISMESSYNEVLLQTYANVNETERANQTEMKISASISSQSQQSRDKDAATAILIAEQSKNHIATEVSLKYGGETLQLDTLLELSNIEDARNQIDQTHLDNEAHISNNISTAVKVQANFSERFSFQLESQIQTREIKHRLQATQVDQLLDNVSVHLNNLNSSQKVWLKKLNESLSQVEADFSDVVALGVSNAQLWDIFETSPIGIEQSRAMSAENSLRDRATTQETSFNQTEIALRSMGIKYAADLLGSVQFTAAQQSSTIHQEISRAFLSNVVVNYTLFSEKYAANDGLTKEKIRATNVENSLKHNLTSLSFNNSHAELDLLNLSKSVANFSAAVNIFNLSRSLMLKNMEMAANGKIVPDGDVWSVTWDGSDAKDKIAVKLVFCASSLIRYKLPNTNGTLYPLDLKVGFFMNNASSFTPILEELEEKDSLRLLTGKLASRLDFASVRYGSGECMLITIFLVDDGKREVTVGGVIAEINDLSNQNLSFLFSLYTPVYVPSTSVPAAGASSSASGLTESSRNVLILVIALFFHVIWFLLLFFEARERKNKKKSLRKAEDAFKSTNKESHELKLWDLQQQLANQERERERLELKRYSELKVVQRSKEDQLIHQLLVLQCLADQKVRIDTAKRSRRVNSFSSQTSPANMAQRRLTDFTVWEINDSQVDGLTLQDPWSQSEFDTYLDIDELQLSRHVNNKKRIKTLTGLPYDQSTNHKSGNVTEEVLFYTPRQFTTKYDDHADGFFLNLAENIALIRGKRETSSPLKSVTNEAVEIESYGFDDYRRSSFGETTFE